MGLQQPPSYRFWASMLEETRSAEYFGIACKWAGSPADSAALFFTHHGR
jgi:hypothetical protein